MTESRWDEIWNKPSLNFLLNHPEERWLREVKAEGDKLKEKAEKLEAIRRLSDEASNCPGRFYDEEEYFLGVKFYEELVKILEASG